ncbi:invertase recombinase-like protein [Myxococcus landrumensis]|uniref:Invertase recombinase-like protein n=1 Tax=Myxococcus landrumensis TaxID=2813577 RepID=A0ABX7NFL5_9BACT|nr:invertase recombinase-like protein [Myxococcus landrumus]QSQ17570.1 invertase recombinase-like protein [Myxococcus landrumus]
MCLTSLLVLLVACGGSDPAETPDAGQTPRDAGNEQPDSGSDRPDAGGETPDSGGGTPDSGGEVPDSGSETPDSGGGVPDSGSETPDSGGEVPDSGSETPDSGSETPDSGSETPDGGSGNPDGGGAPVSVIGNWGFEEWPGALPTRWFGSTSNIANVDVQKVTAQAFEGVNAVRLVNPSATHKRFSTEAMTMPSGRYTCTYQARGEGEVRNAFYGTDYSSYSSYTTVNPDAWKAVTYQFNVATDIFDTFELIFSVRNTLGGHVLIDDVRCTRTPEPCDQVSCESWERCVNATATCEPLSGRCNSATDCSEWQTCDAENRCVVAESRCTRHADCAGTPQTPLCNFSEHQCVEGNPCAGVTCSNPATTCNPTSGVCELAPGACFTTLDCRGELPACDPGTRRCVAASHPSNIIPNGGFEIWDTFSIPYQGDRYIPVSWYGMDNGITDPGTEIKASRLVPYTSVVHGGATALQFVVPIQVAERFSSVKFNVESGNYSCSYRVRGHGNIRHRIYSSAGWSKQTDILVVDSNEWQPVFFKFTGNVRDWRLFFYPSRSVADRDHLQVDDVVCTKD